MARAWCAFVSLLSTLFFRFKMFVFSALFIEAANKNKHYPKRRYRSAQTKWAEHGFNLKHKSNWTIGEKINSEHSVNWRTPHNACSKSKWGIVLH